MDRPCEIYSAEMRVKAGRGYVYPDVVGVCGERAFADDIFDVLLNPTLLVEVLSESTEFYDRNIKANYFRTTESLSEYLFVSQSEYHVEQYTRQIDLEKRSKGVYLLKLKQGDKVTTKKLVVE